MKSWNRVLSIFLIVTMISAIFTGCGQRADDNDDFEQDYYSEDFEEDEVGINGTWLTDDEEVAITLYEDCSWEMWDLSADSTDSDLHGTYVISDIGYLLTDAESSTVFQVVANKEDKVSSQEDSIFSNVTIEKLYEEDTVDSSKASEFITKCEQKSFQAICKPTSSKSNASSKVTFIERGSDAERESAEEIFHVEQGELDTALAKYAAQNMCGLDTSTSDSSSYGESRDVDDDEKLQILANRPRLEDIEINYQPLTRQFYKELLDEREQLLYDVVMTNYYAEHYVFDCVIENFPEESVNRVSQAIYRDHPEMFWFLSLSTDEINVQDAQGNWYPIIYSVGTVYESMIDDIGMEKTSKQFQAAVTIPYKQAKKLTSQIDQVKSIHDYLTKSVEYNFDAPYNQSPYSALVNKQTVCAGYARTFQTFMAMLGINCAYLTGWNHGWDMVELDGEFYNIDVCWDDVAYINHDTNSKIYFTSYDWFCIDDAHKVVNDDNSYEGPNPPHRREGLCTQLPSCEGQKYNDNTWYGDGEVDQVNPNQSNQEDDSYSNDDYNDGYSDEGYTDNYDDSNSEDDYIDDCAKAYDYDPETIFPSCSGLNELFKERDVDIIGESMSDFIKAAGFETSDGNLTFCLYPSGTFDFYNYEYSVALGMGKGRVLDGTLYCITIDGKGFTVENEGGGNIVIHYDDTIYMSVIDQGGY